MQNKRGIQVNHRNEVHNSTQSTHVTQMICIPPEVSTSNYLMYVKAITISPGCSKYVVLTSQ